MSNPRWRRTLLIAAALGAALPAYGCERGAETEPVGPGSTASPSPPAVVSPSPSSTATPITVSAPPVGSPSASPAAEPSARAVVAGVTVQRSGGLAGATQKIVVESDGHWRYTASRGRDAGTVKTGRLSAAQVKRLHLLLGDPSFGSAFYPGMCADGFHYSLLSGRRTVEWDDCGQTNPAQVAAAIVALLTGATPF